MPAFPQRLILSATLVLGGVLAAPAAAGSATPDGGTGGTVHAAATKRVGVFNNRFSPGKVSVGRGSTVVWTWRDGGVRHNVTPARGRGSKTSSRRGHRFSHAFRRRGTFRYSCTIHPSTMRMTVKVR